MFRPRAFRSIATTAAALCTLALSATALPATALAAPAEPLARASRGFDLQAHRGGLGLTTESTLEGFGKALDLGVSTLELDTQITEDDRVVVTHDRKVSDQKCRDTGPVTEDDPEYPYVGKYIKDLTLAQIQTMDCGFQQLPGHEEQEQIRGAKIIELHQVFDLVKQRHARRVKLNIETKVEAGAPEETAPREQFVGRVAEEIEKSGLHRQVTVQSFDWGSLMLMHQLNPRLSLVALTNRDFLQVGQPGASPWLGGIDIDDFDGDLVAAADSIDGVVAISPVQGFPQDGSINDPDFTPYPDETMINDAHAAGLTVIPWTVDDPDTMAYLIDLGVDGIITDRPDLLRTVLADHGLRLPKAYPAR